MKKDMGKLDDFEKNNIFDDKRFKRKMRIMKIKQSIKTLIIVFIAVIIFIPFNEKKSREMFREEQIKEDYLTELKIKNGYISNSSGDFEILGGEMEFEYSKNIMGKNVILGEGSRSFGIFKDLKYRNSDDLYRNMEVATIGGWNINYYKFGYRNLQFFHPEINYKEYRNDLNYLNEIGENKIMEVALSFDRAYKIGDLFKLQDELKSAQIKFIWLNEFLEKDIERFKYEVGEGNYNPFACGIEENEVIGINNYGAVKYDYSSYSGDYEELMNKLKFVEHSYYNELYKEIEERGFTHVDDAEVLGVIVQGSKKDIEEIKELPFIKASVIGVITEK